jgi:hypothetical protein
MDRTVGGPLSPFVGQQVKIRFRLAADGGDERDGWYVDDIKVLGYPFAPNSVAAEALHRIYILTGTELPQSVQSVHDHHLSALQNGIIQHCNSSTRWVNPLRCWWTEELTAWKLLDKFRRQTVVIGALFL